MKRNEKPLQALTVEEWKLINKIRLLDNFNLGKLEGYLEERLDQSHGQPIPATVYKFEKITRE